MPIRMEKHIFKVGGSFAVSIPKNWLDYYGLKDGDAVEMVGNGDLVIRPIQECNNNDT